MKTKKMNSIAGIAFVLTGILCGCSNSSLIDEQEHASGAGTTGNRIESLNGTSEFYFKPSGDRRTWHVVNRYTSSGDNENPGYNMSEYTFTSDSVSVVNNYIGIPDMNGQDISVLIPGHDNKEN